MASEQPVHVRNALLKKWTESGKVYVAHGLLTSDGRTSGIGFGHFMYRESVSNFPSYDLMARVALAMEFGELDDNG